MKNYGYNIQVDETCNEDDLKVIEGFAEVVGVENDCFGNFYTYDTKMFNAFVNLIKSSGITTKVYLYRGVEPNYEWESFGTI